MENEIIQLLKAVTPEVWGALIRQQWIYAWIVSFFTFLSMGTLLVTSLIHKYGEDEYFDVINILYVLSAILLALFIIAGLPRFLNPEYYAVMSILP